ncbi:family 20 glycosylhydrolase [Streptomyces sp. LX-29]|uniref:beta-N-acetylhexosaminidase n=1 Tax=Streptomyces sp. LX-29 TaxID=2900152 RepID=UPI00240D139A|nr:glycoside hydrolase family 20 protein [Streptomyces sp. LX-29]WFB09005.1 family 20 glycosylhydrolase [Streptomyces sp. LX-29]
MRMPISISRTTAVWSGVAAAVVLITLIVLSCQRDTGAPAGPPVSLPPAVSPSPSPSPSTRTPLPPPGPVPAAIPALRSYRTEPGHGWLPGKDTRVVADPEGPLADEARQLAEELGGRTAGGPARRGDLELALRPDQAGGPEAYTLRVQDGRARITAAGEAGAFYGTRTVLQAARAGARLPDGLLEDAPDRPQRGLMLDIARKHYSAEWIEARLREMADLKLNQLALHFSDDQGFRVQSDSHPEVVSAQHLTKDEVRRILALAERLHITVVPEIDSPGHLGAVLRAHPELQLRNAAGTPVTGAIDISNPASSRMVDDLTREFSALFPGRYWHLGGDEYRALMSSDPEASYPQLAAAARRAFGPSARVQDLATDWLNDRAAVAREQGKQPKAWNDGFFRGGVVAPDPGIEVEYWTGREIGARPPVEYLRAGQKVVNLNDEYLYYVLGEPNEFRYPTGERIYAEWSPAVLRGTTPVLDAGLTGADRVKGGKLAVWGDLANAQTPEQVAAGVRMPLRALAQRLWDPRPPVLSWAEFQALADRVD